MFARGLVAGLALSASALSASAATFEGVFARLEIGDDARVTSIREVPSGRELAGPPAAFMSAQLSGGRTAKASTFAALGGGQYAVGFAGADGTVTVAVDAFRGGWTFRVETADVPGLEALSFFALRPVCRTYVGARINGVSDDRSGVVLRAYRTDGAHAYPGAALTVTYAGDRAALAGAAVGLAAGRREAVPEMMRAMTVAAGAPHSASGGGWSLDSEQNRLSYLIADSAAVDTMDDLLSIAERAGVGRFHFRSFWDQYGWYAVATNKFPRELADLRDCSLRAKAAGFETSIHNLSGCIGQSAPWLGTDLADGLRVCHTYTLAAPIPAAGEVGEIRVNERPADDHGYDFAMWSRGNTIRIGGEMFQYAEISREPPYAFRKVRRARFGTSAAAHPAGAKADYLWCFFGAFLADPGTPLADAVADRYARIYAGGDFDGIYCDGLDGYHRWPQACAVFQRAFYERCARTGKSPHFEDSIWTTHGWWFHSMVGSWDYARWSPKSFVDRHVAAQVRGSRLENFQQMTLGWWPVVTGSPATYGYMRDDIEYFGAKVSGYGCGFSLIPSYERGQAMSYAKTAQLTVLGWYERFRRAGAFRPDLLPGFREKGRDFRLAQDADGVWRVRPVRIANHHMVSPGDRAWTVSSAAAASAALRVRPLGGGAPWDGASARTVLSAAMADALAVRAEKGVTAGLTTGTGDRGRTLRLTVRNDGAEANGAWAIAERAIPRPFLDLWDGGTDRPPLAVGLWVKGDGSGADVNLQFHSPADVNNARSEHHLALDFTGWRYFVFSIWRDHRPEVSECYRWPYMAGACYNLYERSLACRKVEHVGLWVNGVEKGKTAVVEISDVRVMAETPQALENAAVTVDGVRYALPFAVRGDEYAELEDGVWTLFALNGEPLRRETAAAVPQLAAGENAVTFDCADAAARAQVCVTALGGKVPALTDRWTEKTRRTLSYEADFPRFFAPHRNMAKLAPCAVRPGERARISYELTGPAPDPVLTVGGRRVRLGRGVKANECVRGEIEGEFEGTVDVALETSDPGRTAATLALVKRYQEK